MRILLVSPNREEVNMPVLPLGLACVAEAAARAGHEVLFLDLMGEPEPEAVLKDRILSFQPECIAMTVRNIDDQNMEGCRFLLESIRDDIAFCKQYSDALFVVGGAGFSIYPESSLAWLGADIGIAGEGEEVFVKLLERLEGGRSLEDIDGLVLPGRGLKPSAPLLRDLDHWPLPRADFLLPTLKRLPEAAIPVQTRRGCHLWCSYCSTPAIEGTIARRRSTKSVVDWMEQWVRAGFTNFYFVDNTFNFPPSYTKALCQEIIDRQLNLHWQAIVYPMAVDEELAVLMAASGCQRVSLGFESGSPPVLKELNKRFSPGEVRAVSDRLGKHGLFRMGFLLLGGPGETRETVEESLAFAESLHLDVLEITVGIRIYPDTKLAATARDTGMVSPEDTLLEPRYYLEKELQDWLLPKVREWAASRPNVLV
ncbi:MAG: radical SAM protein [Candidatus Hydrogenedentes bacterium]|nr:radical SAM protein [Candidatus Hydrogenedentota bacterium]